jgi:hypothetical protein
MEVSREEIEDALEGCGLDGEISIYENYSGRGMYGSECFGIVCNESNFAQFCAAIGAATDGWGDWIYKVRSDSMGLSTIWYWPGVSFAEGQDETD